MPESRSANKVWVELLTEILSRGIRCSPRGQPCRELLGHQTRIDMRFPVITVKNRRLGRRFLLAEAWWILSGRNDVESIAPYSSRISQFSDDGRRFDGAYGPRIIDQLRYVCDSLIEDNDTRQAVIGIWRDNPRKSKDVGCTLSCQFLIRLDPDGFRRLHCIDTMRSSDAWLGWVYDVFNFSMLSAMVLLTIKERDEKLLDVGLGSLNLTAGSQHLYDSDLAFVERVLEDPGEIPYDGLHMSQFKGPGDLLKYLEEAKEKDWLRNLGEIPVKDMEERLA